MLSTERTASVFLEGTKVDREKDHIVAFYDKHAISYENILQKLRVSRGHLDDLRPEELWHHDQDHYRGLEANDELAWRAGISQGLRVVDFCAGLGGPARYFAHRYGAEVVGIELTASRVEGARELTNRVRLQDRVRVLRGDVMMVPLKNESVDVVLSQEAFLYIRDKERVLQQAYRVLKKGGRLAFTDWAAYDPPKIRGINLMWAGVAVRTFQSAVTYGDLVKSAGFTLLSVEDTTDQWKEVLLERLTALRGARNASQKTGNLMEHDIIQQSLGNLIALVQQRSLGGIRIIAEKRSET
jgi:ubiquinone/menaquinone biosynthesis C-methylase UbiE